MDKIENWTKSTKWGKMEKLTKLKNGQKLTKLKNGQNRQNEEKWKN